MNDFNNKMIKKILLYCNKDETKKKGYNDDYFDVSNSFLIIVN
jgi:hypothetical protein